MRGSDSDNRHGPQDGTQAWAPQIFESESMHNDWNEQSMHNRSYVEPHWDHKKITPVESRTRGRLVRQLISGNSTQLEQNARYQIVR